jgi:hypothetical protein
MFRFEIRSRCRQCRAECLGRREDKQVAFDLIPKRNVATVLPVVLSKDLLNFRQIVFGGVERQRKLTDPPQAAAIAMLFGIYRRVLTKMNGANGGGFNSTNSSDGHCATSTTPFGAAAPHSQLYRSTAKKRNRQGPAECCTIVS